MQLLIVLLTILLVLYIVSLGSCFIESELNETSDPDDFKKYLLEELFYSNLSVRVVDIFINRRTDVEWLKMYSFVLRNLEVTEVVPICILKSIMEETINSDIHGVCDKDKLYNINEYLLVESDEIWEVNMRHLIASISNGISHGRYIDE